MEVYFLCRDLLWKEPEETGIYSGIKKEEENSDKLYQ